MSSIFTNWKLLTETLGHQKKARATVSACINNFMDNSPKGVMKTIWTNWLSIMEFSLVKKRQLTKKRELQATVVSSLGCKRDRVILMELVLHWKGHMEFHGIRKAHMENLGHGHMSQETLENECREVYAQIDMITDALQIELNTKSELTAELKVAYKKMQERSTSRNRQRTTSANRKGGRDQ